MKFPKAPRRVRRFAIVLLAACVLIVAVISIRKHAAVKREEAARKVEAAAGPQVRTAVVTQAPGEHTLTLIGETRPYEEATLYAKVSGYLKSIHVDKGSVVKEGDILAVIESPETDQAYEAARADAYNKRTIARRVDELFAQQLVSPQERDQARADADVSTANLHTQGVLKSYEIIRAPFDGVVTSRFADPGALVQNASAGRSGALPVVTVSEIDRLRVDVFVDQREASFVEVDQPVVITRADSPGPTILGHVSRITHELDPRTKMLLTEIDIPNRNHPLVAGSFVKVALRVNSPPYLVAPVEALVVRDSKPYLTAVTAENKITYLPIQIANNNGKELWISSGAQAGERVALNVGDTIPEGGKVRPAS